MNDSYLGRPQKSLAIRGRLFFLMPAVLAVASGQTTPLGRDGDPSLKISIDVKLVVLNVSVRDKKGANVPRLHEWNFRLEENGQPQTIRAFQSTGSPVAVGMVIDNSQSMNHKRPEVAEAAAAFAQLSDPRDEVFIVNFNEKVSFSFPDTKLFITSPPELARALLSRYRRAGRRSMTRFGTPWPTSEPAASSGKSSWSSAMAVITPAELRNRSYCRTSRGPMLRSTRSDSLTRTTPTSTAAHCERLPRTVEATPFGRRCLGMRLRSVSRSPEIFARNTSFPTLQPTRNSAVNTARLRFAPCRNTGGN